MPKNFFTANVFLGELSLKSLANNHRINIEMNEKDAIIQKIISDAQDKAEHVTSGAASKAQAIWAAAQSESERVLIECERECDVAEAELIERKKTLARLEGRKIMLEAKQNAVSKAFDRALELLCKTSGEDYLKYIAVRAEKYAQSGDCLVLSKNAPISREDVEKLEVVAQKGLKVAKTGDFKGGVIICGKISDCDFTFESVVKAYADERSGEVAREIFNGNE